MPFLLLFAISWLAFVVFADKTKWRQLLPVCMLAMLMSLSSDLMMYSYPLWVYQDGTHLLSTIQVHLLDDWGIYPVTTYLFMQYYPQNKSRKTSLTYFLAWTTGVILLEALFCEMGWMKHQMWWGLSFSYLADWLIFYILLRYHNLFNKPSANVSLEHLSHLVRTTRVVEADQLRHRFSSEPSFNEFIRSMGLELYTLFEDPDVEIFLLEIPPGVTVPIHFHEKEEYSFLIQGELELDVESETRRVYTGELVNLTKHKRHGARNNGTDKALVISVLTPSEWHSKWHDSSHENLKSAAKA